MSKLVSLATLQFEVPPKPAKDIGAKGILKWIQLEQLMVDESYQRPIEFSGKKNIRRIIEEFHWTKFGPLIVSPRHGGVYAIIDGQHHAVAAKMHGGVPSVPCWVLDCTPEEEARAFHTINGIVTRVHPQYLFRARIASGDPGAVAADEAARAAGGKIMPYPAQAHQLKVGETLSGKTIESCLGRFGREVVVTAMEFITRTGDGNPGLMKADLIEGFSDCLYHNPKWLALKAGVQASVNARGIRSILADAVKRCAAMNGRTMKSQVSAVLAEYLMERHGPGGRSAVQTKTLQQAAREQSRPTKLPAPVAEVPVQSPPSQIVQATPAPPPAPRKTYPPVVRTVAPAIAAASGGDDARRVGVDLDHDGKFKLTTYLIRKGHMASIDRQGFRIDGRYMDRHEAVDLLNEHRAKADLPPLKISEVA